MRLKSASLDLISKAVGRPTGDELVAERKRRQEQATRDEIAALPKWMNSRQRRNLRKCIDKGRA